MDKSDYVSLEVAKMLKEKGFDEPCEKAFVEKVDETEREEWNDDLCAMCTVTDVISYPRPTLYEAAKWLRNKHQLHIDVGMCGDYSTDADGNKVEEWDFWAFDMYYTTNFTNHIYDCFREYDTYEEALNAGIFEALKFI